MWLSILLLLGGLALLAWGGEWLVRGAVRAAELLGMSEAVAGLTIVALGTSAPELVVSLMAAIQGSDSIAVANVVGSNIFNICVVLGICSIIRPLKVAGNSIKLEWPFLFGATIVTAYLMRDGKIVALEGVFFFAALIIFMSYSVWIARKRLTRAEKKEFEKATEERTSKAKHLSVAVIQVLFGSLLLVLGARWMLSGAIDIARAVGMTERVIGLTVVAAGTGLPELAASVVAAIRRYDDVAIGNIIGSNIFNLLWILGSASMIQTLTVDARIIFFDNWWMIGITLLLFPLMRHRFSLVRWNGATLLIVYVIYTSLLLFRN